MDIPWISMASQTSIILKGGAEHTRGEGGREEGGKGAGEERRGRGGGSLLSSTAKLNHDMLTCMIIILLMFKHMQPPTI